jgi:2',3'-cyclic-nucleotide 2'-phosphodiesterase
MNLNLLFVADIIGKPGLAIVSEKLPALIKETSADLVVANGENGADGRGLNFAIAEAYRAAGVDVITGGNHIFDKQAIRRDFDRLPYALRPLNFPPGAEGKGFTIATSRNGVAVAIVSLQGRTYMSPIDCPFRTLEAHLEQIRLQTRVIFVDFHAEATAEKEALARYFDGKISAVVGTHTHVQTADERILPRGTGFITDAGMTGPTNSIIGNAVEPAIQKFICQTPVQQFVASGESQLNAVLLQLDDSSPRCLSIQRIRLN